MKPVDIVREIFAQAQELPEPYSALSEKEKQQANALLKRFEELAAKHKKLPHAGMVWPMLLSKNGRYEEALELTERQYQESPNWETAVAAANAARRSGDQETAAAMFAKGAEHDPDDLTCFLEIGDIRLEQDRYADALEAYEKALALDERHQWALPSAFYCRHRLGLKGKWLTSLREVANQEGCTCGLEGCLTNLLGGYGSSAGIARAEYLLGKLGKKRG
ncbi:MAG: tetratricopeptide repeat protein [Gemmataceae bacterium]